MILFATTAGLIVACAAPTEAGDARTQYLAYVERSLQIVALSAAGDDQALASMVAPTADFALGSGDVVVPLGVGVEGALAMGERLNAAQYFYSGWDYLNYHKDVCAPVEIEIRFIEEGAFFVSTVTFSYDDGILLSAGGRSRSLHNGQMSEILAQ